MRKQKIKKEKIIVFFIAFIMIASVFGIIFSGYTTQQDKIKYNDFSFVRKGGGWSTIVNQREAVFNYFPTEVEDINISVAIINRLSDTPQIDMTYNFNTTNAEDIALAQYQLFETLDFHFNTYVRVGFTENNSYNLPIITCNDSTPYVPVLYFKESNTTQIFFNDNCIIVEAESGADFLKIKDRILYAIFVIIS